MPKFPKSRLLPFSEFRVRFLHQNDIGKVLVYFRKIVNVTRLVLQQIVAQNCIVEVQDLSKMGVYDKSSVVFAEVFFTSNFDLHLSVSLPYCRSAWIKIIINILNVDYHEFAQSVSWKCGCENVFVIDFLINFKGLHGSDVHDVHEFWDFVHKDHGANSAEEFGEWFW